MPWRGYPSIVFLSHFHSLWSRAFRAKGIIMINNGFYYLVNTQAEFDTTYMASVIKDMNNFKDIDTVEVFYQAIGNSLDSFDTKGRELAIVALHYEYQTVFTLAQTVSKELNLQFIDKTYRAKAVEITRLRAIKAINPEPTPEPKRACYLKELNTAELAVLPIRIMPNIYYGVDNDGNSYEYKREATYIQALKITNPRKIKIGKLAIRTVVTTAKAQIALNIEYNHKVKELFCA